MGCSDNKNKWVNNNNLSMSNKLPGTTTTYKSIDVMNNEQALLIKSRFF